MSSRAIALACLALGYASEAEACTCRRQTDREALARATLVAEAELVDVEPVDDDHDVFVQRLRYRLVRIFTAPEGFEDGDEVWIDDIGCNSVPYDRGSIGGRAIFFFGGNDPRRLTHGYCAHGRSASELVPLVLLQARDRWLARRR